MSEVVCALAGLLVGVALGVWAIGFTSVRIAGWMKEGANLYRSGMMKLSPVARPIDPIDVEPRDLDIEQVDTISAIRAEKNAKIAEQIRLSRTNGFTGKLEPVQPESPEEYNG